MNRTALLATVATLIVGSAVGLAQEAPAPPMLPVPEMAPPPQPIGPRIAPVAPSMPAGGLTDGTGLTPLAMGAPVGAIPGAAKSGCGSGGCYNHKCYRFFTYCPVKGCCCKGCSCCWPPLYSFFLCTPIPPARVSAPLFVDMFPASPVPLPSHTPLTPDPAPANTAVHLMAH